MLVITEQSDSADCEYVVFRLALTRNVEDTLGLLQRNHPRSLNVAYRFYRTDGDSLENMMTYLTNVLHLYRVDGGWFRSPRNVLGSVMKQVTILRRTGAPLRDWRILPEAMPGADFAKIPSRAPRSSKIQTDSEGKLYIGDVVISKAIPRRVHRALEHYRRAVPEYHNIVVKGLPVLTDM